jgi:SecY interacting protein Syd
MLSIENSIDEFVLAYRRAYENEKTPLLTEYSEEWPSACCIDQPFDSNGIKLIEWQPTRQQPELSFSNVEESLNLRIDKQFKALFSRYWSDNLKAESERGRLQILQIWNEDDGKRLQSNLIAHVLMKRRLKQAETLFFALTDEEDFTLSILNRTGEVVLEQVGCEPQEVIAPTLGGFLESLSPVVTTEVF